MKNNLTNKHAIFVIVSSIIIIGGSALAIVGIIAAFIFNDTIRLALNAVALVYFITFSTKINELVRKILKEIK